MFVLIIFSTVLSIIYASVEDPASFVNLLAGTFTDGNSFSTGNTLPLIGYPWGFNHWSPQTRENSRMVGSWWFRGSEHRFTWLRCTHQPSPWIGDWAWFVFGPQLGGNKNEPNRNPTFFWEPRAATIKPYLFDATLAPNNIRLELTPSMHGAMLRVTFPHHNDLKRVCFTGQGSSWGDHGISDNKKYSSSNEKISKPSGKPYIKGKADQVHIERLIVANFNMYVRIESDDAIDVTNHRDIACMIFDNKATTVTVYMATSLISETQAIINMNRELRYVNENHDDPNSNSNQSIGSGHDYSNKQYEIVKNHAHNTWNNMLSRVNVIDPGPITGSHTKQLSIFYSNLARALYFPRRLDEVDINGKIIHYSPYSPKGGIYNGPGVTDNGFWDTFRTVYPMLSLLYPDHLGEIIQGWLNAYQEGGWLPSWASPGYRNCMVGTFADVVIADAIMKDIKGFNIPLAIDALRKDSFTSPPPFAGNAIGKDGLEEYINRGYISQSGDMGKEVVSRSLDFGFADFAISNAFHYLSTLPKFGSDKINLLEQATKLALRSKNVLKQLFKKSVGLFAPKTIQGHFSDRWSDKQWGNGYTEGNAWHHSFPPYAVNPDTSGGILSELHGSKSSLLAKLHELLETSGLFSPGSYGQEIHEMVEARAVAMGQYAHNNQPVHHILWLFAQLGERKTTESTVRFVLHHAYGEDFFAGDEDNGEQGAWYVLSALGLFSSTPGTPNYVAGSPIFRHVRINRSPKPLPNPKFSGNGAIGSIENNLPHDYNDNNNNKYTDIVALGTSDDTMHVKKILWNDQKIPENMKLGTESAPSVIHNKLLMQDGVLQFFMEGESISDSVFDRKSNGKLPSHHQQQQQQQQSSKTTSNDISNKSNNFATIESIKAQNEKIIKNLKNELKVSNNQILLQKTVVSQLQEKLTNNGLESKVNMTHLIVQAAKHHNIINMDNFNIKETEKAILLEAVTLFRKIDPSHSDSDQVIYEHMGLVFIAIIVVAILIKFRVVKEKTSNSGSSGGSSSGSMQQTRSLESGENSVIASVGVSPRLGKHSSRGRKNSK